MPSKRFIVAFLIAGVVAIMIAFNGRWVYEAITYARERKDLGPAVSVNLKNRWGKWGPHTISRLYTRRGRLVYEDRFASRDWSFACGANEGRVFISSSERDGPLVLDFTGNPEDPVLRAEKHSNSGLGRRPRR